MSEFRITAIEQERLRQELDELRRRRREAAIEGFAQAAETTGDEADNSELIEALREVDMLQQRIDELDRRLEQAVIVEPSRNGGVAEIGARVRVLDAGETVPDEYEIVGSHQGHPDLGTVAYDSPLGRAVCGHRAGEEVDIAAPIGVRHARIVSVE